jgi:glutamate formiminotransferase/formiminotetrahydrofolate cyclodeaminase
MAAEAERGLAEYVAAVAAGTATPGGGSVAAVVGALAAALGEMVARLSLHPLTPSPIAIGEGDRGSDPNSIIGAHDRLAFLRGILLEAAAADEAAYAGYRQAAALPRADATERATRSAAMQAALIVATEEPLGVARAAAEVAGLLEVVAAEGNPHLRTDAALGALLAEAALRGALLNVRGNAALLRDAARATAFLTEAETIETAGVAAARRAFWIAAGEAAAAGRR